MAENFLAQLVQSGALNTVDPMKSYANALKMKAMGQAIRGGEIDEQTKLVKLGHAYLQNAPTLKDYEEMQPYVEKKGLFGESTEHIFPKPDRFKSEEDYQNYRTTRLTSAEVMMKLKEGKPQTFHKVNSDGSPVVTESGQNIKVEGMTLRQFQDNVKAGIMNENEWKPGEPSGNIWKPTKRIEEENAAEKRGQIRVGKEERVLETIEQKVEREKKEGEEKDKRTRELETFKSKLKPGAYKVGEIVKVPEGEKVVSYQVAEVQDDGTPILKRFAEGAKTPAVSVTVNQKGMNKLAEEMSSQLAKERPNVEQAARSLKDLKEADKFLNSKMITGFGADYILSFGKALQQAGINYNQNATKNTEAYAAVMAKQVAQIIKQFGAGTGLSDADREYALKAAGGEITLNKESMKKIVEINRKAAINVINAFNEKARQVKKRPGAEDLPYDIEVPMEEKASNKMSEDEARQKLTNKGIMGKDQDGWIKRYKDAGVVE